MLYLSYSFYVDEAELYEISYRAPQDWSKSKIHIYHFHHSQAQPPDYFCWSVRP